MKVKTITATVIAVLLAGGSLLTGCSPSLSPLYRDYEVVTAEGDVMDRIRTALEDAGWSEAESPLDNVIMTAPRTVSRWGIYKVVVQLEAAPLNERYVRVFIHPYRHYITGGRSKIPYFGAGLRRQVVPALTDSFEQQGLYVAGQSAAVASSAGRD